MARTAARSAPFECPVCGAEVPPRAAACPHCGADERSGWDEDAARYDGLDLPDSAFADEAAPLRDARPRRAGLRPLWWLVALGMLLLFVGFHLLPAW